MKYDIQTELYLMLEVKLQIITLPFDVTLYMYYQEPEASARL